MGDSPGRVASRDRGSPGGGKKQGPNTQHRSLALAAPKSHCLSVTDGKVFPFTQPTGGGPLSLTPGVLEQVSQALSNSATPSPVGHYRDSIRKALSWVMTMCHCSRNVHAMRSSRGRGDHYLNILRPREALSVARNRKPSNPCHTSKDPGYRCPSFLVSSGTSLSFGYSQPLPSLAPEQSQ